MSGDTFFPSLFSKHFNSTVCFFSHICWEGGKLLFQKLSLAFDKNFGRIQEASVTSKSQVIPYKPSITSPSSR